MELKVTFKDKKENDFIVDLPTKSVGINQLDLIRDYGRHYIPEERIIPEIKAFRYREFSVSIATEIGRYLHICQDSNEEIIHINKKGLNSLFELTPYHNINLNNGELLYAGLTWKLNYEKMVEFLKDLLREEKHNSKK